MEFEKRLRGRRTVWAFKDTEENKKAFARAFGLVLREEENSLMDNLDLDIYKAFALLGDDPLRLQQFIRIYYPDLAEDKIDRIIVSLRGLKGEWPESEELHIDYAESLPMPAVTQNVQATDGHTVIISGQSHPGISYIQVAGDYTRQIAVRQDGSFSANIPLLKIGQANKFEIYAVDEKTKAKSPKVSVNVLQAGVKENTEEAFLKLLSMREGILENIQLNPERYRFILRATEESLLGRFTYRETEGFEYLKDRIDKEKSPALRKILQAIYIKFQKINEMNFNLKKEERLYFFQKYTIYEILSAMNEGAKGIIVANEPGLGKTVTTLAALNGKEAVILTPNSVVSTWAEQEEQFFPEADLEILEGTHAEREKNLEKLGRRKIVTNIEFTRAMNQKRKQLLLKWLNNGFLVVDEADYLGSQDSEQSMGTRELQAKFTILLTATPFKRISQIGHLLHMFYPDDAKLSSSKAFGRAFSEHNKDALNALFLLVNSHTIRIRKGVFESYDRNIPLEEQSDRLPQKVEMPLKEGEFYLTAEQSNSIKELFMDYQKWCEKHRGKFESDEDREYSRYKEGFFPKREALRQIMDDPAYIGRPDIESPKHIAMDKIIAKELDSNPEGKVVIFTRYRAQVEEYLKRYTRYGARAYYGKLSQNKNGYKTDDKGKVLYYEVDEYEDFVLNKKTHEFIPSDLEHGRPINALDYERRFFQNNPSSRVIIATYDAGALGVTFTAADALIFDDLAQTYRDQYQAGDRIHRIDNKRKKYEVRYYWLQALYPETFLGSLPEEIRETYFSPGTFDQVHYQNLRRQAGIFHRIMDGIGSEEELMNANKKFLKEKMPFLFTNGNNNNEEADPESSALEAEENSDKETDSAASPISEEIQVIAQAIKDLHEYDLLKYLDAKSNIAQAIAEAFGMEAAGESGEKNEPALFSDIISDTNEASLASHIHEYLSRFGGNPKRPEQFKGIIEHLLKEKESAEYNEAEKRVIEEVFNRVEKLVRQWPSASSPIAKQEENASSR
ncbi:DEAD/DEAH box helicase [bacterium]|nr:MAG: DEAD/DEAH box helicase [bacterium]